MNTARQYLLDEHPKMFRNNPLMFIVTALLCLAGVGVIIFLIWWLRVKGERISITQNELIIERGILNKSHTEIPVTGIRTINVKQSFTQRIFGVGSVEVFTAGDRAEAHMDGIYAPHRVREIVRARQAEISSGRDD